MTAAAAFAEFKAGDGEHFHARVSHFGDGVRVLLVSHHHAWLNGNRVIGVIPLFALALVLVPTCFNYFLLFHFERIRHCGEESLLARHVEVTVFFAGAQTDGADLIHDFGE